jgi:hypothetical protein
MINLAMSPGVIANTILLLISVVSFIYLYNKGVKNRVDKDDLKEFKDYVDKQDGEICDRVSRIEKRVADDIKELRETTNKIYEILIKK